VSSPSPLSPRSLLSRAILRFASLWILLSGAYLTSLFLSADGLVLRHPTHAGALHPDALVSAVLALVLSYTLAAAWLGERWLREDFEALRPVVDVGVTEWERLSRELVRPALVRIGAAAALGALFGAAVIGASTVATGPAPSVWPGYRPWLWLLNTSLFAALGAFAWRGVESNRVFAALGERARLRVGVLAGLAPFARAGLRRALLWLLGSSLAALLLPTASAPGVVLLVIALTAGLGFAALLAPSQTLHARMQAKKQAELDWVRTEIARAGDALRGLGDPARGSRLPALIAWEGRVADAPTWPFDVGTKLRFAVLLLVPVGSWLGGAMVERALEVWFG